MRSILLIFSTTIGLLHAPIIALGDDQKSGAPVFQPVIFLQTETNLTPAQENLLLGAISRGISRSTLKTSASGLYGSGTRFAKHQTKPATAVVLEGIANLDTAIDQEVRAIRKQIEQFTPGSTWNLSVELLWHKDPSALPQQDVAYPPIKAQDMAELFDLLNSVGGIGNTAKAKILTIANTRIVDMSKHHDAAITAYGDGRKAYEWLADGTQDQWLPFFSRIDFTLLGHDVRGRYMSYIKPSRLYDSVQKDSGGLFVEELNYLPRHFGALKQDLLRINLTRMYGAKRVQNQDHMLYSFGSLVTTDMRDFATCRRDCVSSVNHVPSLRGYIHLDPNHWLYSWINYALRDKVDVYILLRELAVGIDSKGEPMIIPEKSATPIVIRRKKVFTEPEYYSIGEDDHVWGFNIYERLVRHQVAGGLSGELQAKVKDMDRNNNAVTADALRQLLKSISGK